MADTEGLIQARRFYAEAAVAETPAGFGVWLDGRQARTPGARPLVLPTRDLAELVAQEWAAQGPSIETSTMPATRLAGQVIDGGEADNATQVQIFERYGGSDLVCYFAEAPRALVARQDASWGGLLDWADESLGLKFERVQGITHRSQPTGALARLTQIARSASPFEFAGLAFGAALFGSAVIALALRYGLLDAAAAMDAARLDEIFQAEQWGVDSEAQARADAMAAEAVMLQAWFLSLG